MVDFFVKYESYTCNAGVIIMYIYMLFKSPKPYEYGNYCTAGDAGGR